MLIRYGFDITLSCPQPIPLVAMLGIHEDRKHDLQGSEQFVATPDLPTTVYRDLYGNLCRRLTAPAGDLQIWGDGTVEDSGERDPVLCEAREIPVAELPDECLVFLLGSRYCETDRLSQTAWDLFGNVAPGWSRVQAICDYAHNRLKFNYLTASSLRTAFDAHEQQAGVCRDYAHLAITLLRCMNIPARYVNGYLGDIGVPILDPMDFSAWIEVFLDGRWLSFDPRNNVPRIGRIVVSRGRDAADVPLINSFGPHFLKAFRVWAYEIAEGVGSYARLVDSPVS